VVNFYNLLGILFCLSHDKHCGVIGTVWFTFVCSVKCSCYIRNLYFYTSSATAVCEGHWCCWLDELKCNNTEEFKCHDTGSCIARKELCNGHDDCREGSDEIHCGTRLFHYCQIDCFFTINTPTPQYSQLMLCFLLLVLTHQVSGYDSQHRCLIILHCYHNVNHLVPFWVFIALSEHVIIQPDSSAVLSKHWRVLLSFNSDVTWW